MMYALIVSLVVLGSILLLGGLYAAASEEIKQLKQMLAVMSGEVTAQERVSDDLDEWYLELTRTKNREIVGLSVENHGLKQELKAANKRLAAWDRTRGARGRFTGKAGS